MIHCRYAIVVPNFPHIVPVIYLSSCISRITYSILLYSIVILYVVGNIRTDIVRRYFVVPTFLNRAKIPPPIAADGNTPIF